MAQEGNLRWAWLGSLLTATILIGALFTLFLRHVSGSLDAKPRAGRH